VSKLHQQKFKTAIIECNHRQESSAEEALIKMYMAGVSVLSVKAVTQMLWGTSLSTGSVSNPKKKDIRAHQALVQPAARRRMWKVSETRPNANVQNRE
jgi:transposase-like protein